MALNVALLMAILMPERAGRHARFQHGGLHDVILDQHFQVAHEILRERENTPRCVEGLSQIRYQHVELDGEFVESQQAADVS
jgi:hypothetical protein